MECLGINLTKDLQDLSTETYKTLLQEVKEELNKWRETPCSWIKRFCLRCQSPQHSSVNSVQSQAKLQQVFLIKLAS